MYIPDDYCILKILVRKPTGKSYPGLDLLGPGCREVFSDVYSTSFQNSKTDREAINSRKAGSRPREDGSG